MLGMGLVRTRSLGVLYDAGGSGLRARAGVGEADTWLGLGLGLGLVGEADTWCPHSHVTRCMGMGRCMCIWTDMGRAYAVRRGRQGQSPKACACTRTSTEADPPTPRGESRCIRKAGGVVARAAGASGEPSRRAWGAGVRGRLSGGGSWVIRFGSDPSRVTNPRASW